MSYRLGVDIGGTFTDFALLDDTRGRMSLHKRLTSPEDPAESVRIGTREILERDGIEIGRVDALIHGTTLVTNAIIERTGAVTGMLVTEGFRDVLDMAREGRYAVSDLRLRFPEPLVPRPRRLEVKERTLFNGRIEVALDLEDVHDRVGDLVREHKVETLAVCLLHSYANPAHEDRIQNLIRSEFPHLYVSVSSEISPFIREYERWTTTTVNAYAQPMVDRYLRALEDGLATMGFGGTLLVMMSNGGTATPDIARRFPVRLIESGPVAGALMSANHSRSLGIANALSFDMGGTTAKGTIIHDQVPLRKDQLEVAYVSGFMKGSGLPLRIPVIDMIEIGAGGGSIAKRDVRGIVAVGPASAGARPGPACYGLGGDEPTLTDANLVLGYLDPAFFLGGRMSLDAGRAEGAIERRLGKPLGLETKRAAWAVHETINENVSRAFRVHASQRGMDYRSCSMIAFGGSGPIHALRIARKLRIPEVVFPAGAGVMSAFGLLASPLNHEIVKTDQVVLDDLTADEFDRRFEAITRQASAYLTAAGTEVAAITIDRRLDIRYLGQGYEVEVALPGDLALAETLRLVPELFRRNYEEVFSTAFGDMALEIVNWKVRVGGETPSMGPSGYHVDGFGRASADRPAIKSRRRAYVPEQEDLVECPVYDRYALTPGTSFEGPALVEENESTGMIGAGDSVTIDEHHNLIARVRLS